MTDQPAAPGQVLASQVRAWRERRSLSAQALADRVTDLGGTLSRAAISRIENNDRGVSLDEWLQLAHALAVPPPLLFCDLGSGRDVAIASGAVMHPWLVWEWVTGEAPPTVSGRGVVRIEEWQTAQGAIRLYRRERKAADAVHAAEYDINAAGYAGDDEWMKTARTAHVRALRDLAAVLDAMVEDHIAPPGKPQAWIKLIRDLNLSRYPDHLQVFVDEDDRDGGDRGAWVIETVTPRADEGGNDAA